jgi:hypothetical protein
MNQPSTTAGTWAPDWRALKRTRDKAIVNIPYANDDQFNEAAYGAIVAEYRRQAAAAGLVMVSKATLERVRDWFDYFITDGEIDGIKYNFDRDQTAIDEIVAALATTSAPTPGGGAG